MGEKGFPGGTVERIYLPMQEMQDPWLGKIPWRRVWQPTPVLLPGKLTGQRSLADYSPWGCKESDMTEHTHTTHTGEERGPEKAC